MLTLSHDEGIYCDRGRLGHVPGERVCAASHSLFVHTLQKPEMDAENLCLGAMGVSTPRTPPTTRKLSCLFKRVFSGAYCGTRSVAISHC
jgi:hypothetical protein